MTRYYFRCAWCRTPFSHTVFTGLLTPGQHITQGCPECKAATPQTYEGKACVGEPSR